MIINPYNSTKNYTAMLLNQFSNLQLYINSTDLYKIPIKFSTASRLYKKLANIQDDTFTYRVPIISLEITEDIRNTERKTNPILKRKVLTIDSTTVNITYNDTPIDYSFKLTIIADTLTTLSNIKEAISSSFRNNIIYCSYISPLGESISTPIRLVSIDTVLDNNQDDYEDNRLLQCEINLTVEGVVHSQVNTDSKYIKQVELMLYDNSKAVDALLEQYTIV